MGLGDYLGWLAVITLFVLFFTLIRFLWVRAGGGKGDSRLKYVLRQIRKLNKEIQRLMARLEQMTHQRDELTEEHNNLLRELETKGVIEPKPVSPILVAIGSDAMLKLDIAAFRAVETETGLGFQRVPKATLAELKYRLDLARSKGRPYDKLHLAVHAVPAGIELGGTLVDSEALSEILRGVKILVIAGCETTHTGAFLGVVPYVVTFSEAVSNNDAAFFCEAFWTQIGKRKKPQEALKIALSLSPSGLSEYIEHSW